MPQEYDEYQTVLAVRTAYNFDDSTFQPLPPPVALPGEAPEAFAKRQEAAKASLLRAARVTTLPKGTFVLMCIVAEEVPFEGGTVALATSQGDEQPEGLVEMSGEVAHIVPAIGSDTELWLRRDGEPTAGRVAVVIAYVKARPEALRAAPATEYPKWVGSGHDGQVVKSRAEEEALGRAAGPIAEPPKVEKAPEQTPIPPPTPIPPSDPRLTAPVALVASPPPPPPAPPVRPV